MKILPEQLSQLCRPFGNVLSVVVLHGRGQALVEMDSPSAVDVFLAWSCSDRESNHLSTISRVSGDVIAPSAVPIGDSCNFKLKFDSWPQCATAQRGRARSSSNSNSNSNGESTDTKNNKSNRNICNGSNDNGNNSNSNNDDNNNSNDTKNSNSDNNHNNNNNNNNNNSNSNSNDNDNIHNYNNNNKIHNKSNKNYKLLSDETIRLEVTRSLAVVIKKIVFEDSENRMRERKLRKKNHEILLEGISRKRIKREKKCDNVSSFDVVKNDMSDERNRENENIDKCGQENQNQNQKIPKSEDFLNDWRNNKYCLNKEELGLICWNFVASGGNIEFCPYYRQKVEDINESSQNKPNLNNQNQITSNITLIQTNNSTSKNIQNSPNLPGKCPLFHVSRPVTEMPLNLRALEFEDFFPLAR
jgi:hypothetical protein